MGKRKRPYNPKKRKTDKTGKKDTWVAYFIGLLKKIWESTVVKIGTGALILGLTYLTYNLIDNPYISFTIEVEVLNEWADPIENAEIFVQDTRHLFYTNRNGIGKKTIRVRRKDKFVLLTCASDLHVPQEKLVYVPLDSNPKISTGFVLITKKF
ncbi:MAG: hypothetical protein DHS20C18_14060 [Saprospiraceae bacterium]|nr:MAG: hypothetical protein DHS20C18_14060 [Saprospiraceae bacterium]